MILRKKGMAMVALRLVLGTVVLFQSIIFLYREDRSFGNHAMPKSVRLVLGLSEAAGALLFLLPQTLVAGAWSLLVVFGVAVVFHVVHGQFEVAGLVVYIAVVLAVLENRHQRPTAVTPTKSASSIT